MIADDTKIARSVSKQDVDRLQEDLNRLFKWAEALHTDKCSIMLVGLKSQKCNMSLEEAFVGSLIMKEIWG